MKGRADRTIAGSLGYAATARSAFAVRVLAVVLCLILGVATGSFLLTASGKTGAFGKVGGVLLALEDETAALFLAGEIAERLFDWPDSGAEEDGLPFPGNEKKDAYEKDGEIFGSAASSGYDEYDAAVPLLASRTLFVGAASGDDHPFRPLRGPPAGE